MTQHASVSTRLPERKPEPSQNALVTARTDSGLKVSLESLVAQVRDLPALSAVALRVMQIASDDDSSPRGIAQCISKDPSFAARVLKLANSAYYGLPRTVSTISEAVTLLGNRTVRNMAIMAATQDTLGRAVTGYELGAGDLWRHALASAMTAQMLAEEIRYADPEAAFVAGLLHDVGKVVLGLHVEEAIAPIQQWMQENDGTFIEAERAILGFDHAEVGGRVALHWNLPLALAQAIAWHHQPVQNGQLVMLVALVHVANAICLTAGIGLGADGLRTCISTEALEALHLTEAQVEKTLDRLVTQVAAAQPLFNMQSLMQLA